MMYPYSWYGYSHGPEFGVFGLICTILLAAVIIRFIFGRRHGRHCCGGMGMDSSLEILKARYAKGEINKEEFEQKKKDLQG